MSKANPSPSAVVLNLGELRIVKIADSENQFIWNRSLDERDQMLQSVVGDYPLVIEAVSLPVEILNEKSFKAGAGSREFIGFAGDSICIGDAVAEADAFLLWQKSSSKDSGLVIPRMLLSWPVLARHRERRLLHLDLADSKSCAYVLPAADKLIPTVVDVGIEDFVNQVYQVLGLKFPGSAKRLLFDGNYRFDQKDKALEIVDPFAKALEATVKKAKIEYLSLSGLRPEHHDLVCALAERLELKTADSLDNAFVEPALEGIEVLHKVIERPVQDWISVTAEPSKVGKAVASSEKPSAPPVENKAPPTGKKPVAGSDSGSRKYIPVLIGAAVLLLGLGSLFFIGGSDESEGTKPQHSTQTARQQAVPAQPAKDTERLVRTGPEQAVQEFERTSGREPVGDSGSDEKDAGSRDLQLSDLDSVLKNVDSIASAPIHNRLSAMESAPERVTLPPLPPAVLRVRIEPADAVLEINGVQQDDDRIVFENLTDPVDVLLYAYREGYHSDRRTLTLSARDEVEETVVLLRKEGDVEIFSTPEQATFTLYRVREDGDRLGGEMHTGQTPFKLYGLPVGNYMCEIRLDAERKISLPLVVKVDDVVMVEHTFPASFTVRSTPPSAEVLKDGERLGFTPLVMKEYLPGSYQLELRLPGYEWEVVDLELIAGNGKEIDVQLLSWDRIVPVREVDKTPVLVSAVEPNISLPRGSATRRFAIEAILGKEGRIESFGDVHSEDWEVPSRMLRRIKEALEQSVFEPGERNGRPVRMRISIPVTISAEEADTGIFR